MTGCTNDRLDVAQGSQAEAEGLIVRGHGSLALFANPSLDIFTSVHRTDCGPSADECGS